MVEIFLSILNMSVAGGWVILAVLAVRLLLGRAPKKITCLVWIPAGLRLLVPWSVASPVSLFNLVRPAAAEVTEYGTRVQKFIPGDIGMAADPQISIGIPAADTVLSGSLPDPDPMTSMNPMQFWEAAGAVLWCAGMTVMLTWAVVQYIRLRLRVRTAVRLEGNVYLSENVPSPFILGIFRPKICLPYGMDETLTEQVLLHERVHLRYGDPLTKLIAFGLLMVHWFNPLCWLAFVLYGRDVEMRCDEAALEQTDAKVYGKALVSAASGRRYSVTGPLAFGESSVKERVRHILAWRKPALWVSICAVAVSVVLLV
ncbi:MAG: M56 family metallopeptidase, partial [Clostridia bacterium]|nr:M56 family metallopeptidase [Clostridia bacterium]